MDVSPLPQALRESAALSAILAALNRIADATERLIPAPQTPADPHESDTFIWDGDARQLLAAKPSAGVGLDLLQGLDDAAERLLANTHQFALGLPANNALIWGARGTGKSSLVKAVHRMVADEVSGAIALVEIGRDDIGTLPRLMSRLRALPRRYILFCDDLSFDQGDVAYKALKSALDGGIEGRPDNAILHVQPPSPGGTQHDRE